MIDEEGSNVSAGEKQLITIARAFLADPSLLILDEATSSVDTRTEVLLQQAMAALRTDRTSFVIAHRLSTIRDADLILVMEAGRIVEQGTHPELLAAEGAYYRLYTSQFRGAISDERTGSRTSASGSPSPPPADPHSPTERTGGPESGHHLSGFGTSRASGRRWAGRGYGESPLAPPTSRRSPTASGDGGGLGVGGVGGGLVRVATAVVPAADGGEQHLGHVDHLDLLAGLTRGLLGREPVGEHHPAERAADRDPVRAGRDGLRRSGWS